MATKESEESALIEELRPMVVRALRACLTLLLFAVLFSFAAKHLNAASPRPAQTGPEAISTLKRSGTYYSLERAWQRALRSISKTPDGFLLRNGAQRLEASFDGSGVRIRPSNGTEPATLAFLGYGREDRLAALEPARLIQTGDRIEYRRGSLTEWYNNDPRGLEQGFTIAVPPTPAHAKAPLEIALDVLGPLRPKQDALQQVALVDSNGQAVLRYADLRAWDLRIRPLSAHLEVRARQIRLFVDDAHAVYPITIDPLVTAVILLPSDGASADHFGASIAVDGNTVVAGAPGHGGTQGTAFVFVSDGTSWTDQGQLTASDGARGDSFGTSVSISGGVIVVGAPGKSSGKGAAYVFALSGSTWSQQAELTAPGGAAGDNFGGSVSLSGTTAVVGASGKSSGEGAIYVFVGVNGVWSQQAEFSATDSASGDALGYSVSINGDTAVAGAVAKHSGQGAAYVFLRSSGAWSQQARLAPSGLASDAQFGTSIGVSVDTVIVGTKSKSFATGSAYVFVRSGTAWSQQAQLVSPDDASSNEFGAAVAVNGDTVLCSEAGDSELFGEAYIFSRSAGTWTVQPKLTASPGASGDQFSTAVALSGNTAVLTSPFENSSQGWLYVFLIAPGNIIQQGSFTGNSTSSGDSFGTSVAVSGDKVVAGSPSKGLDQGAVYVFGRSGANWTPQAELTPPTGLLSFDDNFGSSVSIDGNTIVVGASGEFGQGSAYVFVLSGTTWTQQAKLTANDAASGDLFGSSVSINGDTVVVGANGKLAFQGVAYVFTRSGSAWTQQAKLTASDAAANDSFGVSVSVSGDTAAIGARGKGSFQGAAYVFVRSGTNWTQQSKLLGADLASGDNFGSSVSVDGNTVLVGAYNQAAVQGAAYVFVSSGSTWTQQSKLTAADASKSSGFGVAVSLNGSMAVIGAALKSGTGVAYTFARSGTAWSQLAEIAAPDAANLDRFGSAVSLFTGTVVVSSPSKAEGEGEVYVFPFPVIAANGVLNGASFVAPIAPGSLATVFGNNYSTTDTSFSVAPLPTSLNNVSVSVNGTQVPLIFAGYTQVNFQMPYETPVGTANVVVTVNGVATSTASVSITATAPGILIYGVNRAIVQNADFSLNATNDPAAVGTYVTVYAAGLGQLDNPIPTGAAAPSSPLSNAVVVPTVTINGVNAPVVFAGMAPGFVGLAQMDVQIPSLPTGTYPIVIKQGGATSNAPLIDVTQ